VAGPDWYPLLSQYQDQLPMVLMVPVVTLGNRTEAGLDVTVVRAQGPRCERCWLVLPDVGKDPEHADLCLRCGAAII
jgi:hypothetical protein